MRVISKKRLREFWLIHPEAEASLRRWYKQAISAEWNDLTDVRKTFPLADAVRLKNRKTATVFNVGKTGHRMIAEINYAFARVYVRMILTHDEYDLQRWKKSL